MSLSQFDKGYWYATDIKAFAKEIGIVGVSKLRKDELELLIRGFLKTGSVAKPARDLSTPDGTKHSSLGLHLRLPVRKYTNDKQTKDFLIASARAMDRHFKEKSGAKYRLNRWREEQIAKGKPITYGDLVTHFVSLCKTEGRFPQAPSGRYINFLSDFLAHEKDASRDQALVAWKKLKRLDISKDYRSWKRHTREKARPSPPDEVRS
ncbi:MAG: SAP domain-containing protein [Planctomycetota bacterium]|jgi:hypothetical protein